MQPGWGTVIWADSLDAGPLLSQSGVNPGTVRTGAHMLLYLSVLRRIEFLIQKSFDHAGRAVHRTASIVRLAVHSSRRWRARESLDITVPRATPATSAISW